MSWGLGFTGCVRAPFFFSSLVHLLTADWFGGIGGSFVFHFHRGNPEPEPPPPILTSLSHLRPSSASLFFA